MEVRLGFNLVLGLQTFNPALLEHQLSFEPVYFRLPPAFTIAVHRGLRLGKQIEPSWASPPGRVAQRARPGSKAAGIALP